MVRFGRVGFWAKTGDCFDSTAVTHAQVRALVSSRKAPVLSPKSCRERVLGDSAFCDKAGIDFGSLPATHAKCDSVAPLAKPHFIIKNPRIQRLKEKLFFSKVRVKQILPESYKASVRQDFSMILRVVKLESRARTWACVTADESANSLKSAKKPTRLAMLVSLLLFIPLHATPLLLTDYHKSPPNDLRGFLVSEKLDGVRAIWDGKVLKTRSGRTLTPPACFVKDFPPFALDGELWIARGSFEQVASIVSTACKSCECGDGRAGTTAETKAPKDAKNAQHTSMAAWQQSAWGKVRYFVFDVPECGKNPTQKIDSSPESSARESTTKNPRTQDSSSKPSSCTLTQRLSALASYLKHHPSTPIRILEQTPISSQKELFALLDTLSAQGAEGLVLRKDSAPYERGRSKNALKLKRYDDAECKIIAHNPGKGKYRGMLGSITCEQELALDSAQASLAPTHASSKPATKTLHFKIGSGFSDEQRQNPPPLGTIITYKHYGFTKNGIPRFAIFHRIYTP